MSIARYFSRADFDSLISKEVQYILTSTSEGSALNMPTSPAYKRVLNKLYESIAKSAMRAGGLEGNTPGEKLRNTPHYKLAQILKSVTTFKEFKDNIKEFVPQYKENFRNLLGLGGFRWLTKFTVPEKEKRKKKTPKNVKITKPEPDETSVSPETSESLTLKACHDEIELLRSEVLELKTTIDEVREFFKQHKHVVEGGITSIPVAITDFFDIDKELQRQKRK